VAKGRPKAHAHGPSREGGREELERRARAAMGGWRRKAASEGSTATGDLFCFYAANPPPSAIVGHRTGHEQRPRSSSSNTIDHARRSIKRPSRRRLGGHAPGRGLHTSIQLTTLTQDRWPQQLIAHSPTSIAPIARPDETTQPDLMRT
jgi:hypothetical protein